MNRLLTLAVLFLLQTVCWGQTSEPPSRRLIVLDLTANAVNIGLGVLGICLVIYLFYRLRRLYRDSVISVLAKIFAQQNEERGREIQKLEDKIRVLQNELNEATYVVDNLPNEVVEMIKNPDTDPLILCWDIPIKTYDSFTREQFQEEIRYMGQDFLDKACKDEERTETVPTVGTAVAGSKGDGGCADICTNCPAGDVLTCPSGKIPPQHLSDAFEDGQTDKPVAGAQEQAATTTDPVREKIADAFAGV